jgi:DNA-directed RNA polymerase subunit E'/Rpb7
MFILSRLEDNVRITPQVRARRRRHLLLPPLPAAAAACRRPPPSAPTPPLPRQDLGKPAAVAITAALEKTFLDKAVDGLGLVVTLYDILSIGDGYVYHSDGGAHYRWVCCRASVLLCLLLLLLLRPSTATAAQ